MKYDKIFLIILLLIILCTLCAVSASDDFYEDNLTSEEYNQDLKINNENSLSISDEDVLEKTVTVSGNTFDDIENTIDNAKNGDTIKLTGTYTGKGYSITIRKNVTIQGPSESNKAVLDANELSGIIFINNNIKITLKNIIFKNSDGAMVLTNDDITIENCNFEKSDQTVVNCQNSFKPCNLVVKNCIFNDNDGIYTDVQSVTVEKSTFTNCNIPISLDSFNPMKFLIKECKFENNCNNGAIYGRLGQGNGDIINCEFTKNSAEEHGGAIWFKADENFILNILNSTFSYNTAKINSALSISNCKGSVKNSIFINNKADDFIGQVGYVPSKFNLENNTVKSNENINENLIIEFLKKPSFYGDICQIKFTKDGKTLSNKKIHAYSTDSHNNIEFDFITDSNGIGKFSFSSPTIYMDTGIWDLQLTADSGISKIVASSIDWNIKKLSGKLLMNSFSTTYKSGKTFNLKLVNSDNAPAGNVRLYVTVYKNGWYLKNYRIVTDLNGFASVNLYNWDAGNYKITITSNEIHSVMSLAEKSISIKLNKAPTKVKAPKVTNKFKKSKYFKVNVKAYNKPLKNVKVKVKVFTGKKSKTYSIKTDKNGVAKLNTKKLSKGNHKVVISSGNKNYKISAKSKIIIK